MQAFDHVLRPSNARSARPNYAGIAASRDPKSQLDRERHSSGGKLLRKIRLMNTCSLTAVGAVFLILSHLAGATQANDTTITINGHTAGATPFISKLSLDVSNTSVLKSIQFAIDPKPGSVTRPL